MKSLKPFCFLLLLALMGYGCKKSESSVEKQLEEDEQLIKEYLAANNLTAQRHQSGIYYIISNPGSGTFTYTTETKVEVKYTLRLLGGSVIPQTTDPISFRLSGVISGWQIGVPLIQPGGKIRLLLPSFYAYGPDVRPGIPANSVLDYDIDLLNVTY